MKIICVNNFDNELVSDKIVCENVSKYYGEIILKFLVTEHSSNASSNFYRLVKDDYKLYKFEPLKKEEKK